MSNWCKCPYCLEYVDLEHCGIEVVKGSTEYAGGPPIEPDETYHICSECGRTHDEFEEAEVETLIEELKEAQDKLWELEREAK